MSRALRGKGLHTWHGMIGYCMKDSGQPHFAYFFHGISQTDIDQGQAEYAKYGAGPLKNRCVLTAQNLFHRALIYWLYIGDNRSVTALETVLRDMLRTGKYYPAAAWVTPHQGRGMVPDRARALWDVMREPAQTTLSHVQQIFFGDGRETHARLPRYFENPPLLENPQPQQHHPRTSHAPPAFQMASDTTRPFIDRFNEAAAARPSPPQATPDMPEDEYVPLPF
jgi:hypothetical protein